MNQYFAFLRSINVGGRNVKMDRLRALVESLGLSKVETFIASGNVIFESKSKNPSAVETRVEDLLEKVLGYEVATFIRDSDELLKILNYNAFPDLVATEGLYLVLIKKQMNKEVQDRLLSCRTKTDDFHFNGREIYWRCRTRFSDSEFSGPKLEKILGVSTTVRKMTTIRGIAETYLKS